MLENVINIISEFWALLICFIIFLVYFPCSVIIIVFISMVFFVISMIFFSIGCFIKLLEIPSVFDRILMNMSFYDYALGVCISYFALCILEVGIKFLIKKDKSSRI